MSLINNILGNIVPSGSSSKDQNSQTDFDFDDAAADGVNIGISVDPRPVQQSRVDQGIEKSRAKAKSRGVDPYNKDGMLMGERVFFGLADQDDQWSTATVSNVKEKPEQEDEQCKPNPCTIYKGCVQKCIAESELCKRPEEEHQEAEEECEEPPPPKKKSQYRSCCDPCKPRSRSREGAGKAEKPRRECSDLCRVAKQCAPPPCCPRDLCDRRANDPCAAEKSEEQKVRQEPCYDPCKDPCYDWCKDPCGMKDLAPEAPSQAPADPDPADCEDKSQKQEAEQAIHPCPPVCPPCPPCPACPKCPECPACPPCPSPQPNTSKSPRSCGGLSPVEKASLHRELQVEQKEIAASLPSQTSGSQTELSKPTCPDPLFPLCKKSDENCEAIVCPED